MSALLQVRPAAFPLVGFSAAPPVRAWAAWCGLGGRDGLALLICRSSRLDRPGWDTCMAAGFAHMSDHKKGGRL
ncbi:hypothetical protein ABZ904_47915 [Streptomyces sp. NPDC046900]|uniref:hypothetical protein n=1 Tax=Streptomyces sp. NPDC046900 TaxID=3155473 RepID=UPI0033EFC775